MTKTTPVPGIETAAQEYAADLLWGDFGGACLASTCRVTPDLFSPRATILGLQKSASFLIGTWRTADGEIHHIMRWLEAFRSPFGCFVFTTRGSEQLALDTERLTFTGGIETHNVDDSVRFSSIGHHGFAHSIDAHGAGWHEDGLLEVAGEAIGSPTQWYNPWRSGGGGCAITAMYRSRGTVLGSSVDGFIAHETHFFPAGHDFLNSPMGFGGREIHWGHMATAFADGTSIAASLAVGRDGWGFALLTDESGRSFQSSHVDIAATIRRNGYPEQITYRFLDQTWIWDIADKGERADIMPGGPLGAEGILRRAGDDRPVTAAMGIIDWWNDGRQSSLVEP